MKLYEICFSPTGGTKKALDILTNGLNGDMQPVDLTDRKTDFSSVSLAEDDVAVIGVPSYGGRVPAPAAKRLSKIQGNGAKAVLVCVYGNRAYEDTLAELQDTATQSGFRVIAAVAAIAEHSIVRQFAAGRPDHQDQTTLHSFAGKIQAKLDAQDISLPSIPGNRPYKKGGGAGMVPKPSKACVNCGLCAEKCPVQAIDLTNPKKVDSKTCISCMRCVSICPHSARKVNGIMLTAAGAMLKKACSERKECELYI
nr:4Fe-4S binding protein [uncultured Sellimonas sp.]